MSICSNDQCAHAADIIPVGELLHQLNVLPRPHLVRLDLTLLVRRCHHRNQQIDEHNVDAKEVQRGENGNEAAL